MRSFIDIVLREGLEDLFWFWFHPDTEQVRHCDGTHTMAALYDLGLDMPEFEDVDDGSDDRVLRVAIDAHWVRGRYIREEGSLALQGLKRDVLKTARWIADRYPYYTLIIDLAEVDNLHDIMGGGYNDITNSGLRLRGGRKDFYLKRGTIPTEMVMEAAIPPSRYGYWIDDRGEYHVVELEHDLTARELGLSQRSALANGWLRISLVDRCLSVESQTPANTSARAMSALRNLAMQDEVDFVFFDWGSGKQRDARTFSDKAEFLRYFETFRRREMVTESDFHFTHLYHCTDVENVHSIFEHGLDPAHSKWSDAVYLAGDELHAWGYDGHHGQLSSVMLKIDLTMLDEEKLLPDDVDLPDCLGEPDDWERFDWKESIQICGQCRYEGVVPPAAISIIKQK